MNPPPLPTISIRLAEGDGKQITVTVVMRYKRGFSEMIMSASSGPKEYFKNDVVALFDAHPEIENIMLVRGQYQNSQPFVLLGTAENYWRDIYGHHVVRCDARAEVVV